MCAVQDYSSASVPKAHCPAWGMRFQSSLIDLKCILGHYKVN